MRFADYFGRAFSGVIASQFPWVRMFRESPVAKIVDVSLTIFSLLYFSEICLFAEKMNCFPLNSLRSVHAFFW